MTADRPLRSRRSSGGAMRITVHASAAVSVALALTFALVPPSARAQGAGTVPDFKSTKPTPRTADGRPDLSGFWRGTRETQPGGNIGKDLPGFKLPLTPAGEAA